MELQKKVEALLFAWGDALSYQKLSALLEAEQDAIKEAVSALNQRYEQAQHGIQIIEVNQSVQMASRSELGDLVEQLFISSKNKGLSNSLLEVLSIVAYKQPITKVEIENIRGVRSDRSVQHLVDMDYLRVSGELERIGRPKLYSTTDFFLKKFGLKSLRDLPPIQSFERLQLSLFDEGDELDYGK